MFLILDHPIHPPTSDANPFECEMYEDLGYILKMENGIMKVYQDQQALDHNEPIEWPYPDRNTFLVDQSMMLVLMADGPL